MNRLSEFVRKNSPLLRIFPRQMSQETTSNMGESGVVELSGKGFVSLIEDSSRRSGMLKDVRVILWLDMESLA